MPGARLRIVLLVLIVYGLLTPFLVSHAGNGAFRSTLAVAGWASWAVLPVFIPFVEVRSGVVLGKDGATFRAEEPMMFWCGVLTHIALGFILAGVASFGLYTHFFPILK